MPKGDADRIRGYLCRRVEKARQAGETRGTFRAGDVHDALGLKNAHHNVCQVLDGKLFHARAGVEHVSYVYRSPSGQGANLEIEFRILPMTADASDWVRDDVHVTTLERATEGLMGGYPVTLAEFEGGIRSKLTERDNIDERHRGIPRSSP